MAYLALAKKVQNAFRLSEMMQVLIRHGFADLLSRTQLIDGAPAKIAKSLKLIDREPAKHISQGQRLRNALTELGPTFVKMGQVLSARPDLLGVSISQELEDLQDNVPPVPFEEIRKVFEESLHRPIKDAFASFDETPIASASLSQVYRATLKTGQPVAVKIQRPDIAKVIHADISLLESVAEWMDENVREFAWTDPAGLVNEFGRTIERELDFEIERHTIDRFRRNFESRPDVITPETYPECCSGKVLTMDFINGVRIDEVEAYAERHSDPKKVAEVGCHALFMQIAQHGLFHADPHPGNIMLTYENAIAFLDFGMVGHLDPSDVLSMAEVLVAVMNRDPEACYDTLLQFTVSGEVENESAFRREISDYMNFEAESILASGSVGKALDRIVTILHRHQLRLAPRFGLLLKALATIESTGRRLDPELDMIPILRPYVEGILSERLSPTHILTEIRDDVLKTLLIGKELPDNIRRILRMLSRGQFKIQVNHEDLDTAAAHIDRASNRITVGLITSAIIVGSSLLVRTGQPGTTIGLVGFCFAGILGVGLIISILRAGS